MPPTAKKPKKPKLALKTSEDNASIEFGEQPAADAAPHEEENSTANAPAPDDPLAEFRRASSAAAKALKQEKEKHTEIERHLLCVFDEMEQASTSVGPGSVLLNDVLDAVSRGTAPLTARATTQRPSKAVRLRLPPVFNRDEFLFEMRRVASLMDDATFEANVLGLFACFYEPVVAHTQRAMAEITTSSEGEPATAHE